MTEPAPPALVHGTCVALGGAGILLRGPSASGKSDLALRLIEDGGRLVADDQVALSRRGNSLTAAAPASLAGRIEVRGLGIVRLSGSRIAAGARLVLVVDLVAPGAGAEAVERLPRPEGAELLGVRLPRIAVAAFEASAPAKVRLAAGRGPGSIMASP